MKDLKKEITKIKSHIQDVEKHLEAFNNYLSIAESFDNHLEKSDLYGDFWRIHQKTTELYIKEINSAIEKVEETEPYRLNLIEKSKLF